MLRITTETNADGYFLKLEGCLAGAWVPELAACWRQVINEWVKYDRVSATGVGQRPPRPHASRLVREREDPEPLELFPAVAAESEQPATPGMRRVQATAELEGPAVPGEHSPVEA